MFEFRNPYCVEKNFGQFFGHHTLLRNNGHPNKMRRCDAITNWLEFITYLYTKMTENLPGSSIRHTLSYAMYQSKKYHLRKIVTSSKKVNFFIFSKNHSRSL